MTSVVFFIERISFGLYILCAAGILLMAFRLQQARRELAVAQFKLEREHALVRQATAITIGGLLIEIMVGVWAIANVMAPTVRDLRTSPQSGPVQGVARFVTSTPAPNPPIALDAGGGALSGPAVFATPVPTATPVGTIIPGAPEIAGCPRENAWLLVPGNGQIIFETTTFWGTATTSDFAFYRFELKPAVAGAEFAPIGDYSVPVVDGPLGDFYPINFANGEYRFRLTVFDTTQSMRHLCEVTIHISEPPPTPTPIGAGAVDTSPP